MAEMVVMEDKERIEEDVSNLDFLHVNFQRRNWRV